MIILSKPKVFLFEEGNENSPKILEETGYMNEDALQELLADYPDLLPGDQIDPESPRSWLLVSREMGVPNREGGGAQWSLDHLFLDQDGIPTFVECKCSSNPEIRRKVVAQMLDYAANGTAYWSMDKLRQAAAESAQGRGASVEDEIAELIGDRELDIEGFWDLVEDNLRNHRVRLVFVADSTPRELRRLVEFLNEEMEHVEVLAVEVKLFQKRDGTGLRVLAPRVVGLTESARSRKEASHASKRLITREVFMKRCISPGARDFFQRVLEKAGEKGYIIYWGTAGFSVRIILPNGATSFVYCYPDGVFQFYFCNWLREEGGEHGLSEAALDLRGKLLDRAHFSPSGNWTLNASVTEENIPQLDSICDLIYDEIEKLGKNVLISSNPKPL